jgi:hypothetical protein
MAFGDKWDPDADAAAVLRRNQIASIASSRGEKVSGLFSPQGNNSLD